MIGNDGVVIMKIFILSLLACFSTAFANDRAYNLILAERNFGNAVHCYVLLGLEGGKTWNLLGGKKDPTDKTRGAAAARELYEESAMLIDKRGDIPYWTSLPAYEYGKHKVFIHDPKNLDIKIFKLNDAARQALSNKNLSHHFKEMHRYQLIKLTDLVALANNQTKDGQAGFYNHPQEQKAMMIDGWMLYTLKNANKAVLASYLY